MLTLTSPAKINLFLKILGRRPDGYHELASLFQAISLYDTITYALHDRDELTCTDPHIPLDNSNLIFKAATLFRKKTGLNIGLKVHLIKRIPSEAGLGGGSSNAATTLWALNLLCGKSFNTEDLIAWSGEIGSDITFFLSQGTAYCTGRGEMMKAISPLPSRELWLVKPKWGLSTPHIYNQLDIKSLSKQDPHASLERFMQNTERNEDYYNDLENSAFKVSKELAGIKRDLLNSGFEVVLMSGSGSSLFCLGEGHLPDRQDLSFHRVKFCHRQKENWYTI